MLCSSVALWVAAKSQGKQDDDTITSGRHRDAPPLPRGPYSIPAEIRMQIPAPTLERDVGTSASLR